jgi:hypothetical protein
MRATVRFLAFSILALGAVALTAPATGCDGGGGPTGTGGGNLCGRITFSSSLQSISVTSAAGCSATTGGFTNHQFDEFGRILSFNFDITCTAGASERLVGQVFNVTYNNLGEFVSAQATINGQSCTYNF